MVALLMLSLASASAETAAHNADEGELNPVFDQYAALITSAQPRPMFHYSLQMVSVLCAKLSTVATCVLDPGLCQLGPNCALFSNPVYAKDG